MNKKLKYLLLVVFAGLLMDSCEVPYDIPISQGTRSYVVDGTITDLPGPYIINLNLSAAYSVEIQGSYLPVENAQMSIIDTTTRQVENLMYIKGSEYQTDANFQGVSGHVYILHIITRDNDELISYPEQLPHLSPVEGGHYSYVDETAFHPAGDQVWVTINDTPGEQNFYRWTYQGVYQFTTLLSNFPYATSCWMYDYFYFNLRLASDRYFDGNTFDENIDVVPYFSVSPYLMTVTTQSLTERAYNFWHEVDQQVNKSSGIFGEPPFHIQGNMYCVNDSSKEVLGYFGASSEAKTYVFIKRTGLGKVRYPKFYPIDVPCGTYTNAVPLSGLPQDNPPGWQQ